jgi:coenzyme F420-reducing hydrogenase delta subunit
MKFITSSTEFFELQNNPKLIKLRECISAVPINNWKYIHTLKFEPAREISKQEAMAITSHQIYLLENFDSISEINRNESLLNRYGYTPVSLTLEGAYLETLESLKSLNESLLSSVKDFLLLMTEGGEPIGILHFVLDILSLIPTSWIGFPFDVVASLLNAVIYIFQDKPSYIMAFINIVFAASGPIGAGIKVAVKPFLIGAEKLFAMVFKGAGSAALKAGAMDFKAGALVIDKAAASAGGIIPKLGDILQTLGKFLLTTGLAIINGLIKIISKALSLVGFGEIKLLGRVTKWIDEIAIKITVAGKAATEVGELLVKDDVALIAKADVTAAAGALASKDLAIATGKDAITAGKLGKGTERALEIVGFSGTIEKAIKATDEWATFMKGTPNQALQTVYLEHAVAEKLIGGVLNTKSTSSLINLMKSPEISGELVAMGFKPAEMALLDALKAGDSSAISKLFGEMAENPKIMEHILAKEEMVAKTLSIFKEVPEALIAGTKNMKKIQKTLARLTGYRATSLRVLIGFIVKQCMKGTDCGRLLTKGSPDEILSYVSNASKGVSMSSINELLSKIVINEDSDPMARVSAAGISAAELEKFKTTNPEAYKQLVDQLAAADAAKTKLITETKINPCQAEAAIGEAKAAVVLVHNAYRKDEVETALITSDDFKKSKLTEYTKTFLELIKQDTNIDPQHPISSDDPVHIAYIADAFSYKDGSLNINESPTSNLDKTLDELVADGKLHPDRREEVKNQVLDHWKNGTIPESFSASDINLDESFFKIGKLITRR